MIRKSESQRTAIKYVFLLEMTDEEGKALVVFHPSRQSRQAPCEGGDILPLFPMLHL